MLAWLSGKAALRVLGIRSAAKRHPARRARAVLTVEPLEGRDLPDATTLFIGTWNVDTADPNGANRIGANFQTVLAAMGQEDSYAGARAPDILTLTEVRSNANTGSKNDTDWVAQQMNAVFGDGLYAHDTLNGASTGGGTEGVLYNTQTVQLVESKAVGMSNTTGTARQELRYLFRPAGFDDSSMDFYVSVGHAQAGTTTAARNRRHTEGPGGPHAA